VVVAVVVVVVGGTMIVAADRILLPTVRVSAHLAARDQVGGRLGMRGVAGEGVTVGMGSDFGLSLGGSAVVSVLALPSMDYSLALSQTLAAVGRRNIFDLT
jgi:hypothetical protein